MFALALLLIATLPCDMEARPIDEHVDTLEYNQLYCTESGEIRFSQWIVWDRNGYARYWIPAKHVTQHHNLVQIVTPDNVVRRLRYTVFQHTITERDPELLNRDRLPKENRHGLLPPYKKLPLVK